jgi:hypothetical protein
MDANQFKQQQAKGNRLAKLKPYLTCHLELMDYLTNFKRSQEGYKEITEFEVKTQMGLPDPPPFAEKKMLMDEDWVESMRQYCLMSAAQRGLSTAMLEALSRRLVQRFGLAMVDDLLKMQRGTLLYEQVPGYMFWADRLPAWEDVQVDEGAERPRGSVRGVGPTHLQVHSHDRNGKALHRHPERPPREAQDTPPTARYKVARRG